MRLLKFAVAALVGIVTGWAAMAADFVPPPQPLPLPLTDHVRRFLDSTNTPDLQCCPVRTYRASPRSMKYDARTDYFFSIIGNSYFSYRADDLLTGTKSLSRVSRFNGITGELYLEPSGIYDGNVAGSGWHWHTADKQAFLNDFAFDDRGIHYLAYDAQGWGMLSFSGGAFTYLWDSSNPANPSNQLCVGDDCSTPIDIYSVKVGATYYAIVGTAGSWAVYNVTQPTAPTFIAVWKNGMRLAVNESGTVIAAADLSSTGRLIDVQDFVAGRFTGTPVNLTNGTKYWSVVADGDDFWFLPYQRSTTHVIHKVTASGQVTAYPVTLGEAHDFWTGSAGAGLLVGVSQQYNAATVFAIEPGGLRPLENVRALQSDYYMGLAAQGTVGGILPVERNGTKFIVWNAFKLGDVYKVQPGESISISRNTTASAGTPNPNSPNKNNGPYYGDLVTFDVEFNGNGVTPPSTINWTFGNPESGASNSTTSAATASVNHRYAGLSTSSAIGATKTITAVAPSDPKLTDSLSLALLVPKARVLVPGTNELVESSTKALGKVLVGSSFYDASDGTIESHQAGWSLDGGAEALQTPGAGFGVGVCGDHTLSLAARYDSYTSTVSGLSYTVQSLVAGAAIGSSNTDSITFVNTSKYGSGFQGLAVWTETWELVDGSGAVVSTQTSNPVALGTVSPFVVERTKIATGSGYKVRVRVSVEVDVAPPGCAAYLSDSYEYPLIKPDPKISTLQCTTPTTLAGSCTLTVGSSSGLSTTGWTYRWYVNGIQQTNQTSTTFAPTFSSEGSYSVKVDATSPLGTGENQISLLVTTPPCVGAPTQGAFSIGQTPLGGRAIRFDAKAFNYTIQTCDEFTWTFGDGGTGSGQIVDHTYAADGTYTARLTVKNSVGQATASTTVSIGVVTPPPPPPPPPCADPRGKVYVGFAGPTSGCEPGLGKPPCNVGEQIQFNVDTFGVTLASCHSYSWNFGDGTTSTLKAPKKAYSAASTYTVSLSVSNGSVAATTTGTVKTQTTTCGTAAPSNMSIFYFGLASGCKSNNTVPCQEGEQFDFSIQGYTPQACEVIAWNFGDGSTSSVAQPRHAFGGVGPYTVTASITNTHGTGTAQTIVRFFDPSVPKPTVTVTPLSTKAKVGATLHFIGGFQTGAEHPLTAINWKVIRSTFGEEVVRTENNIGDLTHTFNEIGDYRVELTATNAGGVSPAAVAYVTVAEVQEYSFIIPVVAHLPGSNGTQWRTDLQIFNTDPLKGPIEFEFEFRGGAAGITKTFTMTSSTQIYEDFLAELSKPFPALSDAGPMIVRARGDSPPQMWSRTYTVDASGIGSYGQFIPAVSLDSSLEAEDRTVTYVLPGLEISPRFRTNVGIVNPSNETVSVNVMARDDTALGFPIGNFDISVPPLSLVQIGNLMDRIGGIELGAPFSLNIRTLGNSPIVVYGSMIDQLSNDPVYIAGVRDIDQEGEDKKVQVLPGSGHLEQPNGTWRSDVVVYNDDLLPIHFDLSYFDGAGSKVAEALNQPLGPGAFVRVEDVLKWTSLDKDPGDTFGLIKVETRETVNRYPIVFERTYKDRGELGSFGQGIQGISPAAANVSVGEPAFIAGVRSDESYYTNLGIVALGNSPSVVLVTLLDEGSGNPVGNWQYVVDGQPTGINPNASLIVTNVIRAISSLATKGTLKIEVVSGGGVWAYASVIAAADPTNEGWKRPEHTFDPEYVPAVRMPTP